MCNTCIHKEVCGKCKATGGQVGKCEHFAEERHGYWMRARKPVTANMECSVCHKQYMLSDHNYCPNCGVRMDGERSN